MPRVSTNAAIKKQLQAVEEKLSSSRATGERRLALLRRQAQLGDERDAAVEKARRSARDD